MFGIVRPCQHRMCGTLHAAWLGHLCGLCLTLRDEHGHCARLVTNYDGLLISVLVEAQAEGEISYRRAAPCALRGFRRADVVSSVDSGARLAAAVSLVLAAGKTRDHVADSDGALRIGVLAGAAGRMADRWAVAGARTGHAVGFDTGVLVDAVARQSTVERSVGLGSSVLVATEPTETAVAAAFAHTAVLAGMPGNTEALSEVGRYFGRIAHLLDAVEDYADDHKRGAFNPLRATGTGLVEARRLCDDAHHGLRLALDDVKLRRPSLARALLVHEVEDAIERTFAEAETPPAGSPPPVRPPEYAPGPPPQQRPDGCGAAVTISGACALTACTCGLWQPPWSKRRRRSCGDRCWCKRCCEGADCCNSCDCCCPCDC